MASQEVTYMSDGDSPQNIPVGQVSPKKKKDHSIMIVMLIIVIVTVIAIVIGFIIVWQTWFTYP